MKKETIHISVDAKIKKWLVENAKEKGLTLNAYVRMLLLEKYNEK